MARIRIDDLPIPEKLTPEEEEQIRGAGRFRPTLEALENREMYAADLGAALAPSLMALGNAARGDAHMRTLMPALEIQMGSMANTAAPLHQGAGHVALSPALDRALWGGGGIGGATQASPLLHGGVQDRLGSSLDTN